jgi:transposase
VRAGLPHAVLVADRFHLVRLANDTVSACRQRVIRETEGRRGRKVNPAWRLRRRLLTAHERLRGDSMARMWNTWSTPKRRGGDLVGVVVKEGLRACPP